MTVLDAIEAAGGLKHSAGHHIEIIHSDNSRSIFHADTFPYGVKKPPLLRAGDIVSVPIELLPPRGNPPEPKIQKSDGR